MNIQNQMKELFGNSCYAYCLAYIFGKDKDIKALTARVLDGWYFDYIQEDGFVKKPVDYVKMIDNSLKFRDVKKVPISSLSDIPDGMIVPVDNPDALANAINQMLNSDLVGMGEYSRSKIKRYSIENMVLAHMEFLRRDEQ
jgi:hypothetical protein